MIQNDQAVWHEIIMGLNNYDLCVCYRIVYSVDMQYLILLLLYYEIVLQLYYYLLL